MVYFPWNTKNMTSLNDGPVCSGPDSMNPIPTTSSSTYGFRSAGDTNRLATNRTIATPNASGLKGEECWDDNYEYRCIANNTWRRCPRDILWF